MTQVQDVNFLDQVFLEARSMNGWTDRPVGQDQLTLIYDLMKMAPTSANCSPARLIFITSQQEKEKLAPLMMEGNRAKVLAAPVTAIIGYDLAFADHLPMLFPHDETAPSWFADPEVKQQTAFRNGSLQGAYFMLAARAIGLDCGPMSGFDAAAVDKAYFSGTLVKSNFICSIGYGDPASVYDRLPRFDFDQVCSIV